MGVGIVGWNLSDLQIELEFMYADDGVSLIYFDSNAIAVL